MIWRRLNSRNLRNYAIEYRRYRVSSCRNSLSTLSYFFFFFFHSIEVADEARVRLGAAKPVLSLPYMYRASIIFEKNEYDLEKVTPLSERRWSSKAAENARELYGTLVRGRINLQLVTIRRDSWSSAGTVRRAAAVHLRAVYYIFQY